jgi:hypothetical protein
MIDIDPLSTLVEGSWKRKKEDLWKCGFTLLPDADKVFDMFFCCDSRDDGAMLRLEHPARR